MTREKTRQPPRKGRCLLVVLLLCAVHLASSASGQSAGEESLLIRRVRLFDRSGEVEDVVANLVIRKGRLDLVTKDPVAPSEVDLALEAEEGVLLGKLELGQPASFVVLDEDPRENVEILLDTKTHVRFAIANGEILRNELRVITGDEAGREAEVRQGKWLSYTPPPFALPLTYGDTRKWNRFETKPMSGIFMAGAMLDRQKWLSQDAQSHEQVGDLQDFSRGEVRALMGFVGTFNFKKPWVYAIVAANNAFDRGFDQEKVDDFTLVDLRLDIPLIRNASVSIGKQKEPISMDRVTSPIYLPISERAAVSDGMLPLRNVGVVFNGILPNRRVTWALGGFNDWLDASQDFHDSATQIIGRITGLPFVSGDESNLFHLGLGVRYDDAKEGLRYRTDPELNLAPIFVDTDPGTDTGIFAADGSRVYDLELSWRRGPFWVHGELLRNEVAAPALGDPVLTGHHLTASWILSGEMRPYYRRSAIFGPVPVARSVYQGGWGAWEVAVRWSELDLTDGGIEGGEMQILSAAVNWWLTPFLHFDLNYRRIELDRFGFEGTSDGILSRVVLILE